MTRNRVRKNKLTKTVIASVVLASSVVPALVLDVETAKAAEMVAISGFHQSGYMAIKDMEKGTSFEFGGSVFIILDPSTGYAIKEDVLDIGYVAFDSTRNNVFNPNDTDNIANYLNTTYLNSFSPEDQALILDTQWGINSLDENEVGYGGRVSTLTNAQMKEKENLTKVTAKVGLLSASEMITYYKYYSKRNNNTGFLEGPGTHNWLRIAYSKATTSDMWVDTSNGSISNLTSSYTSAKVRPTLYLDPTYEATTYDYKYTTADGEAEIIKYYGHDTDLVIPNELDGFLVTSIGDKAVYENSVVTTLTLNENLKKIGNNAFYNNKNITAINFNQNLKEIKSYAFAGIDYLKVATLPEGLETIDTKAFSGTDLEELTIPSTVTTIGTDAFKNSPATLKKVYVLSKYVRYISNDINSISLHTTGLIYGYEGSTTQTLYNTQGFVALPEGAKSPTVTSNIISGQSYKGSIKPTFNIQNAESVEYTLNGEPYDGLSPIKQTGQNTLTVKAINGVLSTTKTYNFNITENSIPTVKGTIDSKQVKPNKVLTVELSKLFSDLDLDTLTYEVESESTRFNEAWIVGNSLKFVGEVEDVYKLKVRATDGYDYSDFIEFNVNVSEDGSVENPIEPPLDPNEPDVLNEAPVLLNGLPNQIVKEREVFRVNIKDLFFDADTEKLDYIVETSDSNISKAWVDNLGNLKFVGDYADDFSVTVKAFDGKSYSDSFTFSIKVVKEEVLAPPIKEDLVPVDSLKSTNSEVISLSLNKLDGGKSINLSGLLRNVDMSGKTLEVLNTNEGIANYTYDNVKQVITFEPTSSGFTNIQVIASDGVNEVVLLFMIDVTENPNASQEYIANGKIYLDAEAYVVALDKVYPSNEAINYTVSIDEELAKDESDTNLPDMVEQDVLLMSVSPLNARVLLANTPSTFVYKVPAGVTTTTLYEGNDLVIRLINGKLVTEGKKAGNYTVNIQAETASGQLNPVTFNLEILSQVGGEGSDNSNNGSNGSGNGSGNSNSGSNGSGNSSSGDNGGSNVGGSGSDSNSNGDSSTGGGTGSDNGDNGTGDENGSENGDGSEIVTPTGDLTEGENGDLIIEIAPGKPTIDDTIDIVIDDDSINISNGDKEYDSSISNGLASYANKRVIRDEGNGVFSTVPHFVEDNKLHIKTKNPNGLVITSRVTSNFLDTKGLFSEKEVEDLYNYLIVNGTTATTYSPNADITRGQFSVMIARALELKPSSKTNKFDDASGKWYADQVQALYETGIITGFTDGTFGGEKKLSRQQAAAMITRMLEYMEVDTEPTKKVELGDMDRISDYAKDAVQFLAEHDVLNSGEDTNFNPYNNLTRAQMAKVLMRSLQISDWY